MIPTAIEKEKCWAKHRFPDLHCAAQAADSMRGRGRKVRTYRCKACCGYHLTRKKGR